MAGYTRNDTSNNIATGNVINAADLDGEFDALVAAFHASTGHTHDGTAANGAPITKIGPAQDLVISTGAITPKTDNTVDLGSSSFEFKDLYIDGTANIDALVADTADINAGTIDGVTLGTNSAVTEAQIDNININGNTISSTDTNGNISLVPNGTGDVILTADTIQVGDSNTDVTVTTNGTGDLIFNTNAGTNSGVIRIYDGANGNIALTPNGTGEVDISKVDIDSGAIDGTAIGANSASTGAFTTLSASSTVTLSGGTADGVLYLNGSKVATSGSVLTFDGTKLTIGTATAAGALTVVAPASTAYGAFDAPTAGFAFTDYKYNGTRYGLIGQAGALFSGASQTDFGILASSSLVMGASGSEQMRLTSTGLGIGTSSPAYKLHVVGGNANGFLLDNGGQQYTQLLIQRNGAANTGGDILVDGSAGTFNIRSLLAGSMKFYTSPTAGSPTDRMTLDASGNLGLGVTPSAWDTTGKALQFGAGAVYSYSTGSIGVFQNAIYSDTFRYVNTAAASRYTQTAGQHQWYNAPSGTAGNAITFTQAMTLDASGNLGVGTSSPSDSQSFGRALDMRGSTGSAYYSATSDNTTRGYFATYTGGAYVGSETNHPLIFRTNNTERARITSGGDFVVGYTAAGAYDANDFSYSPGINAIDANHATGTASGTNYIRFNFAGGTIGSISQNGTTAVAYNTTSDYRLKDNQQPLTGSGAFIDALKPKTWNWKSGGKGVGFIAHEVQEVSPGSVVGTKDAVDADGKPVMQAMEYGSAEFIANIIAELQSLRQRVALLEGN